MVLGDVVIKGGKIHFIRPIEGNGSMQFLAESFPYKKKGKRQYILDISGKEDMLKLIYKRQLEEALERHNKDIGLSEVEFKEASCRVKKGKLRCKFPLTIAI